MKRFPDWLFKELPYLYVCIGLLTMFRVHDGVAVLSALTLISAGCFQWLFLSRATHKIDRDSGYPSGNRFMQISWNKSFECGDPNIDEQHRRLFGLGNELIDALLAMKPKFDVELLFDQLINHIATHFRTEEAILAQNGHPITIEHHELHRTLLVKATDLRSRYHCDQIIVSDLIGFITYDVVAKHIAEDDLKWAVK